MEQDIQKIIDENENLKRKLKKLEKKISGPTKLEVTSLENLAQMLSIIEQAQEKEQEDYDNQVEVIHSKIISFLNVEGIEKFSYPENEVIEGDEYECFEDDIVYTSKKKLDNKVKKTIKYGFKKEDGTVLVYPRAQIYRYQKGKEKKEKGEFFDSFKKYFKMLLNKNLLIDTIVTVLLICSVFGFLYFGNFFNEDFIKENELFIYFKNFFLSLFTGFIILFIFKYIYNFKTLNVNMIDQKGFESLFVLLVILLFSLIKFNIFLFLTSLILLLLNLFLILLKIRSYNAKIRVGLISRFAAEISKKPNIFVAYLVLSLILNLFLSIMFAHSQVFFNPGWFIIGLGVLLMLALIVLLIIANSILKVFKNTKRILFICFLIQCLFDVLAKNWILLGIVALCSIYIFFTALKGEENYE